MTHVAKADVGRASARQWNVSVVALPAATLSTDAVGSFGSFVIASPSESMRASMCIFGGSGWPIIESADDMSKVSGKVDSGMRLTAAGGPALTPAARAIT